MVALAELSMVSVQKPSTGANSAKATYDGISAGGDLGDAEAERGARPAAAAGSSTRRAASSAPVSEPIAIERAEQAVLARALAEDLRWPSARR